MSSPRFIFRFAVWSIFCFIALTISGSVERRAAVDAGRRYSEDFARMIQSTETWWKERAMTDPAATIQVGRAIKSARYSVRGATALLIAGLVVWFSKERAPNKSAAPNGGPATQLGNSGVTEGPPSVS